MRTVELILPASESHLPGDFVVRRALPRRELRRVGGFVFLDHFDQADITPELFDVPPHPHVGLQTVTYLFEGEILHTDSLDNQCTIAPGDVNWMTAGRGITHSEQVLRKLPRMHGIQSWVGLPHDNRKTEPAFEHFAADVLPVISGDGFTARVIAGEMSGERSPIATFQQLVYLDVNATAGGMCEFAVDPSHELAVYVCTGEVKISERVLKQYDLGKLSAGDTLRFDAVTDTQFVIIGGEPLAEPTVIYWNFITDTIGEAKQKAIEWEEGKFPPVEKYEKISSADDQDLAERQQLL